MIQGSIVALVTPMAEDSSIDWAALKKLVDRHIEMGTGAIVSVGTTGESATLDFDEHEAVIQYTVEAVGGRIPVIAGTGANSTSEALYLTQRAKALGADACLLVTPYYNKPTQEGLYLHFRKIAESVDIPQILYNVPGRTACDMGNPTVLRLATVPNIVGIKDATGDLSRGRELIASVPADFAVYSGDDATAIELILAGGKGNISVTANVATRAMAEVCGLALQGRAEEARAAQAALLPLHAAMFVESNPIPVKWALYEMGLIGPGIRLPLTPLSEGKRVALSTVLRECGILGS
jgi:4-hydroxy-tetrahydrodipicolinate synthase